jgi:dTDP-4-dehydrorhamnose reductase
MILVVGAQGMLGTDLMKVLTGDVRGVDQEEIDVTSFESTRRVLLTLKPDLVVNVAAYTDVDGCESNRELAMAVNGEGVAHLALAAREIGAKLVHVSTDYVFDGKGTTPLLEDNPTNPLSVYGESKLAGELNARLLADHLIVRTQWLYGIHGKNFVETMLRLGEEREELGVVDDQIGSPTWTCDLSLAIKALIDKGCRGTYHAVNAGYCSWNAFARAIFEETGLHVTVKPLDSTQLGRPAPRPLFSVLDCSKLAADTGFRPEPWQDALRNYLKMRIKSK